MEEPVRGSPCIAIEDRGLFKLSHISGGVRGGEGGGHEDRGDHGHLERSEGEM